MSHNYLAILTVSTLVLALFTCTGPDPATNAQETEISTQKASSPAEILRDRTVAAHGGKAYDRARYSFVFRKNRFEFENEGSMYRYVRYNEGDQVIDEVSNEGFVRIDSNANVLTVADTMQRKYTESINSVIYFATLPHKLLDPAVNVELAGRDTIKGQAYERLRVHFNEAGGGTDFEDEYRYWINTDTDKVDYLAYNYKVNGGGVRFREAYNARVVDGITFQDYVNYAAPVGTPLDDLSALFSADQLRELSRIELEDVRALTD